MRDTQIRKEGKNLYSGKKQQRTPYTTTTNESTVREEIQNREANLRAKFGVTLSRFQYKIWKQKVEQNTFKFK